MLDVSTSVIGKDHHRHISYVGDSLGTKTLHHPLPITHPITKVNLLLNNDNRMATCSVDQESTHSASRDEVELTSREDASQDYDFVEQPDQDFYCPVSLEILLEPQQTDCCGQHISQKAADRLIKEGKPCPLCKDENFTTHQDKYFNRKVKQLKVCCPHKKSGCVWVGELGDLNQHSTSCPNRPWKCQHCNFETTYEVGTNDHTPNCTKYPEPCPNCCEIGTVPRCDVEKHLLVCPLQFVECEFAHAGCDVKVPREDLAKHMTENAQHHLMSTTLLNLRLTRELHQKMEEKDQQIVHLQQQVKETDSKIVAKLEKQTKDLDTKLQQQTKDLDTKLQQQTKDLHTKLQQVTKDLDTKLQQQTKDIDTKLQQVTKELNTKLQQQTKDLDTKLQQVTKDLDIKLQQQTKDLDTKVDTGFKQQAKETSEVNVKVQATHQQTVNIDAKLDQQLNKLQTDLTFLALSSGFTRHEFTLTEFKKHQAKGRPGDWYSDEFYNHPGGYHFQLGIYTNGYSVPRGTHLTPYFFLQPGDNDDKLKWPIKCTVYLQMLNQRGDHRHHTGIHTVKFKAKGLEAVIIGPTPKFFQLAKLGYCADQNTEYLKNDCLKFQLYLKVESV